MSTSNIDSDYTPKDFLQKVIFCLNLSFFINPQSHNLPQQIYPNLTLAKVTANPPLKKITQLDLALPCL